MIGFGVLLVLLLLLGFVSWGVFRLIAPTETLTPEEIEDIEIFDGDDKVHDITTVAGRAVKAREIMTVVKARLRLEDVGSFELYKDKSEEFRFRLFDGKGNNILMSEGYKRKANCIKGINSVKKNAIDSSKFTFSTSKDSKDYFTLRATNGRTLGKSQFYPNISEALETVDLVIVQAVNDAIINDLT